MKLRWCCTQGLFWITNSSEHRSKASWPGRLGNYLVCKKFVVQILLWSMEFMIQNKSQPRHQCSLKLGSMLKYLNKNWNNYQLKWYCLERSLLYRNQPIALFYKSMEWFLYDRDFHHERVKQYFSYKFFPIINLSQYFV